MAPLRIQVNGESTIYRPAERAILSVLVRSEGNVINDIMKDVMSDSNQVKTMLSELATKDSNGQPTENAAITHWSNSTLSTGSYTRYDDDGKESNRVHYANITFEAKFQDFEQLGSCTTSLAVLRHVSITGVEWRLTDETKQSLTTESRHRAVRDAVQKATDYAAALDYPAPQVVEIHDTGSQHALVGLHAAPRRAAMLGSGADTGENISFAPEDVSLNCSVRVICQGT